MATDVLLIAEARIPTVELLERVVAYLEEHVGLRARSRLLTELVPEDFTPGTYPLLIRSFTAEAVGLTRILRRNRIPYGFYLDDNFWLLDPDTELGRHYAERPARRRLETVVRGASHVIAATTLLRDYLRTRNPRVVQLDSFFDFSLIPELPPAPTGRHVVRGGFAASLHRFDDLRPVLDQVFEVLDEHANFEFELIGVDDDELPAHPRVRTFAYRSSYAEYVEFQASRQWDFGLAPLGRAASNLYKTDNKYREYAAQGIPGIYQRSAPYDAVRDGETGLIVDGQNSWRDAMNRYVVDAELRQRIRVNARQDAERRHSLGSVAPQWAAFFAAAEGMEGSPEQLAAIRRSLQVRSTAPARAARRARLLWEYGRTQLAQHGVRSTALRTLRFAWNHAFRRSALQREAEERAE